MTKIGNTKEMKIYRKAMAMVWVGVIALVVLILLRYFHIFEDILSVILLLMAIAVVGAGAWTAFRVLKIMFPY